MWGRWARALGRPPGRPAARPPGYPAVWTFAVSFPPTGLPLFVFASLSSRLRIVLVSLLPRVCLDFVFDLVSPKKDTVFVLKEGCKYRIQVRAARFEGA